MPGSLHSHSALWVRAIGSSLYPVAAAGERHAFRELGPARDRRPHGSRAGACSSLAAP